MAFAVLRRLWSVPWRLAMPFLVVAFVIVVRNPTPILRAEFWAEDGAEFFSAALTEGWRSLFHPVYGYQFLLSRVIAYVATFFPVIAAPYLYAGVCLIVDVLAIGYFARRQFSWIIASPLLRASVCVLLATGPGAGEVMMNLCNLMTPLTLLSFLVLLEDPDRLSWPRFGAILFLACSAGPVFLLAPLVLYLGWRNRDTRYLWLFLAMCPVFVANVVGNHLTGSRNGLLNYRFAVLVPKSLAENFSYRLFVLPLLGATWTAKVMSAAALVFWPTCLAGASVLWFLWRRGLDPRASLFWSDRPIVILLIGYACGISTFAGIMISRSYAVLQITREFGDPLWHVRYAYLPGAIAILLWVTVLHRLGRRGQPDRGLQFALLAVIAASHGIQWQNVPERQNARWPEAATVIQQAVDARRLGNLRSPVTLKVPVQPCHWNGGVVEVVLAPN